MLFLMLSNVKINFLERELNWRLYTTIEILPTIKQVELVGKKVFVAIVLDPNDETYVIHIASLTSYNIYSSYNT